MGAAGRREAGHSTHARQLVVVNRSVAGPGLSRRGGTADRLGLLREARTFGRPDDRDARAGGKPASRFPDTFASLVPIRRPGEVMKQDRLRKTGQEACPTMQLVGQASWPVGFDLAERSHP